MPAVKKILKIGAIVIVVLIAIPLIIALFVSKDYTVERDIIIEKPVGEVFDYVKYLRNQDNYSVWVTRDPDIRQDYRGTDGTVGFVSAWEGNEDVGKGQQTITGIIDGERIDFELQFIEPFEANALAYMTTRPVSAEQTNVTWGVSGRMSYPSNLLLLLVNMDNVLGNDLQTGLVNLKTILEEEYQ